MGLAATTSQRGPLSYSKAKAPPTPALERALKVGVWQVLGARHVGTCGAWRAQAGQLAGPTARRAGVFTGAHFSSSTEICQWLQTIKATKAATKARARVVTQAPHKAENRAARTPPARTQTPAPTAGQRPWNKTSSARWPTKQASPPTTAAKSAAPVKGQVQAATKLVTKREARLATSLASAEPSQLNRPRNTG